MTGVTAERSDLGQAVDALVEAQEFASDLTKDKHTSPIEDEGYLAALQQRQAIVGTKMHNLFAIAENYPDLKSSDHMLALQAQLEGTENRINVTRMQFNEAVNRFNSAIRQMPASLIAGIGDFKRKAYFQSDEGSNKAPELQFN